MLMVMVVAIFILMQDFGIRIQGFVVRVLVGVL